MPPVVSILLLGLALTFRPAPEAPAHAPAYDLVMLGDSLTAGYRLPASAALPARLDAALEARGFAHVRVINAGVSGDTAADGLRRFDFSVPETAEGVLIALGGNDLLQRRAPDAAAADLDALVVRAQARGLDVFLAGVSVPTNVDRAYAADFASIYPALAARHDVPLYPELLAPLAERRDLFMSDGVHPTAEGVDALAGPLADFLARRLPAPAP